MRILYFHQHFATPSHAGGTRSYEFAQQLIARGHTVHIVCGKTTDLNLTRIKRNLCEDHIDGIRVSQIDLPYSNNDNIAKRTIIFIRFSWQGIKFALRENYDLLFATSTPLTAGIPGIIAKIFKRKTFVFEVRDLWPEIPKALGMKNPFLIACMSLLEYLSYRCSDACIGLSPGICEGIKRRSPIARIIKMIPNGCDLEVFHPLLRKQISLEGITPSDKVAVFAGAHGVANGLDAILNAAHHLIKLERRNIKIILIGDGKMKDHLQQRANKEKLINCIFFPPMPKNKLSEIIASADIGLMILSNTPAFYYGTSPNKFFDYISSGLPVLNNYPGWLADMITENSLGIVVPPDDPKALAEGLIALCDDDQYRKHLGRNARKFAENQFSREKLSTEFVDLLESVAYV
ncbi:MAG: glycosyltransferase family 4 protein [Tannerellaceae bacterium]|jgi:glycosyltransferase involved in cell wall biosynthesis|nr:glycosyltransferase family 4 protein [Tannerellaceae bacterium]